MLISDLPMQSARVLLSVCGSTALGLKIINQVETFEK